MDVLSRQIDMSLPDISDEDVELVTRVLRSRQLSLGPYVEELERAFAAYVGTREAVAVSSGTAGLHLTVIAAGLRAGDEVITTPFSFVASSNCLVQEGVRPVFVDIDPVSLNIDPRLVEAAVTERTRAILPVHVFGQPCAMTPLQALAEAKGLRIIEDACEALGAEYRGRKAGNLGDFGVFGFYPNKQITMGEGGIVTTNAPESAALLRSLRNQGRSSGGAWLFHERLGFNYRLDEMSAALGLSQLRRVDALLAARARVAQRYGELLSGVPDVELIPIDPAKSRMSWFVLVVRFAEHVQRDEVVRELQAHGVPSRTYFPPIHLQPYMRERYGYRPGDFPVTERAAGSTLALPFHGALSDDDIERVVETLARAVGKQRG